MLVGRKNERQLFSSEKIDVSLLAEHGGRCSLRESKVRTTHVVADAVVAAVAAGGRADVPVGG